MTPHRMQSMVQRGEPIRERSCRGWRLDGMDFSGGVFLEVDFDGVSCIGTHFEEAQFDRCTLNGVQLN